MARNFATLTNSAAVTLAGGVAKTVLQLKAVTVRVAVQAVTVSFDGTSNTAVPVTVLVQRQTTAGTMTARTPQQKDNDIGTALVSTGAENASAEPTAGGDRLRYFVHPQAGVQYPLPIPGEFVIKPGEYLGVTINAPAGVDSLTAIEYEE